MHSQQCIISLCHPIFPKQRRQFRIVRAERSGEVARYTILYYGGHLVNIGFVKAPYKNAPTCCDSCHAYLLEGPLQFFQERKKFVEGERDSLLYQALLQEFRVGSTASMAKYFGTTT